MSAKLSVEDVLSTLEARAVFLRDREAFHAQHEQHHREQRTLHAAELAKVQESLNSFRAAAPTALELARQVIGPSEESATVPDSREDVAASGRTPESRRIRRIVKTWDPQEPFGPTAVAGEVNRRYRGQLKRPVDRRAASNVLRRMHAEGKLHLVRPGKAFHEALYRRVGG